MKDAIDKAINELVTVEKYDAYLEQSTKRTRTKGDFRDTQIRLNVTVRFVNEIKNAVGMEELQGHEEYNRLTTYILNKYHDKVESF